MGEWGGGLGWGVVFGGGGGVGGVVGGGGRGGGAGVVSLCCWHARLIHAHIPYTKSSATPPCRLQRETTTISSPGRGETQRREVIHNFNKFSRLCKLTVYTTARRIYVHV